MSLLLLFLLKASNGERSLIRLWDRSMKIRSRKMFKFGALVRWLQLRLRYERSTQFLDAKLVSSFEESSSLSRFGKASIPSDEVRELQCMIFSVFSSFGLLIFSSTWDMFLISSA